MPAALQPRLPRWIAPSAGLAVVLLAAFAAWGIHALRSRPAPPPRVQARRTVVVLPFENVGGSPDTSYFAEAMTDEVLAGVALRYSLSLLARLPKATRDPRDAARQLGADLLLEGTARREAGRGRLSSSLLDITTGATVWSQTEDRPFTEAYDDYLHGRAYLTTLVLDPSLQMLAKAVELDAHYAAAHAWLAAAYALHYRYVRSDPARLDQAAAALDGALRLAPDLPETKVAQALLGACQGAWEEAVDPASKALDLRPTDPWTHFILSWIYTYRQPPDPDRIRHHAEEALRFAPELGPAYVSLAHSLVLTGHFAEADAALQRALALLPDSFLPHLGRAQLHLSQAQYLPAEEELATALALTPEGPLPLFYTACLHASQGHTEEALTAWESAVQKGFHDWDLARHLPYLESIRSEERFLSVLR